VSIARLEKRAIEMRSFGERIADVITRIAGSMTFIIFNFAFFALWIPLNVSVMPGVKPFDPFPFSFLTMMVSLEAIFLALLVLMTQQRMMREAEKRTHLDLQLNMLAEQEGTIVLRMLQRIAKHLGVKEEQDKELSVLQEQTNVSQLAQRLEKKFPGMTRCTRHMRGANPGGRWEASRT
jgi:uncharacterized membrane protein